MIVKRLAALVALVSVGLLVASCGISLPSMTQIAYCDYSEWVDAGFYVSSQPYYGEHTPCGDLYVYKTVEYVNGRRDVPLTEEVLQMAVEHAMLRKANGLVNVKITTKGHYTSGEYFIDGVELSGYCIRIPTFSE